MDDWTVLQSLRNQLDAVDDRIIGLFAERYALRRQIKAVKKNHGLPVQDPARVTQVVARAVASAKAQNVPTDFAAALYQLIIDYSHKFEEESQT